MTYLLYLHNEILMLFSIGTRGDKANNSRNSRTGKLQKNVMFSLSNIYTTEEAMIRGGECRVRRGAACVDYSWDWRTTPGGIDRVLLLHTELKYQGSRVVCNKRVHCTNVCRLHSSYASFAHEVLRNAHILHSKSSQSPCQWAVLKYLFF